MTDLQQATKEEWASGIKLPMDMAQELQAIARAEKKSMVELIRQSVSMLIEAKRLDPEFQERLRRLIEEERIVLERLVG